MSVYSYTPEMVVASLKLQGSLQASKDFDY